MSKVLEKEIAGDIAEMEFNQIAAYINSDGSLPQCLRNCSGCYIDEDGDKSENEYCDKHQQIVSETLDSEDPHFSYGYK